MNNLQTVFNKVTIELIEFISKYYPKSKINKYKIMIYPLLNNDNPKGILMFIKHIYKNKEYRENIRKGNDKFFIEQENINSNEYKKIFGMGDLWLSLDDETKKYIKKSLLTMVIISEKYIDIYEKSRVNVT